MRNLKGLAVAAVSAAVLTAVTATVAILLLIATTSEDVAYRTGLFDAVFFSSQESDTGSLLVSAGVENIVPLVVIWAVLTFLVFLTWRIFRALKAYRATLLQRDAAGEPAA